MQELKSFAAGNTKVKVIDFSRNFGHQRAVCAGISFCTGDIAVIMDADLQDPPEVIPRMIEIYEKENCNVVYGVRSSRKGETLFKRVSAALFYRFINKLSEVPFPLDSGDFRLIDRKVIDEFKKLREKNKYVRGLITWIGFKHVAVHYEREPRFAGETKYPLSKMIVFASNSVLYFTKKPLNIAVFLGFFSVIICLILTVYIITVKLFYPSAALPGWASTLLIIIFMGGVQMLTVGVIGKYIGSIFDEVKDRPEYIINEKINISGS